MSEFSLLKSLRNDQNNWVKKQYSQALEHLESLKKVDKSDKIFEEALSQLRQADPGNIQEIAASQIKLLKDI